MGIAAHRTPTDTTTIADTGANAPSLTLLVLALLTNPTLHAAEMATPQRGTHTHLTGRETDVLRLVVQGLTNAAIADRLYISPGTVAQHLQSIYGKLGVSSRTAAAHIAFRDRLC